MALLISTLAAPHCHAVADSHAPPTADNFHKRRRCREHSGKAASRGQRQGRRREGVSGSSMTTHDPTRHWRSPSVPLRLPRHRLTDPSRTESCMPSIVAADMAHETEGIYFSTVAHTHSINSRFTLSLITVRRSAQPPLTCIHLLYLP